MSQQTTTFPIAGGQVETVPTSSKPGETTRQFSARHLDELYTAMHGKLAVGPQGSITRPVTHNRVCGGQIRGCQVTRLPNEQAPIWAKRIVHVIAKFALANPADL